MGLFGRKKDPMGQNRTLFRDQILPDMVRDLRQFGYPGWTVRAQSTPRGPELWLDPLPGLRIVTSYFHDAEWRVDTVLTTDPDRLLRFGTVPDSELHWDPQGVTGDVVTIARDLARAVVTSTSDPLGLAQLAPFRDELTARAGAMLDWFRTAELPPSWGVETATD